MADVKLPLQPLIDRYGGTYRDFRATVKASSAVLTRAKSDGLSVELADRYAKRCDLHPIEIWGVDAWLQALTEKA